MGVGGASASTEKIATILDRFPGGTSAVNSIEFIVSWARANSLWPLVYGTACCAMEMMSAGSSRHDWARFGVEVARATPRQADLIILAGTIVEKMASNLVTLYEQMPGPKYVIAMGSCAISGGPFFYDSYSVVKGGDRIIPVDVYVPGCPPRPEALLYGLMELQRKIRKEGRQNPWKIGTLMQEPIFDSLLDTKNRWLENEEAKENEMAQARKRFKEAHPDFRPPKKKKVTKVSFPAMKKEPRETLHRMNLTNSQLYGLIHSHFDNVRWCKTTDENEERSSDSHFTLQVNKKDYLPLLTFLKEDTQIATKLFVQLTVVDWKDHFDVIVQLLSVDHGHQIFIQCSIDHDIPEISTITPLFKGADWHEREAWDLFGVQFTGHPDLRRIFLNDSFPGHPLRKDFSDPSRVINRPY